MPLYIRTYHWIYTHILYVHISLNDCVRIFVAEYAHTYHRIHACITEYPYFTRISITKWYVYVDVLLNTRTLPLNTCTYHWTYAYIICIYITIWHIYVCLWLNIRIFISPNTHACITEYTCILHVYVSLDDKYTYVYYWIYAYASLNVRMYHWIMHMLYVCAYTSLNDIYACTYHWTYASILLRAYA